MIEAIGSGILLGLGLALITGPIFFALLQTSMSFGSGKAFRLASGIWVSDVLYVLALLFLNHFFGQKIDWNSFGVRALSLIGGLVIGGLGIVLIVGKRFSDSKLKISSSNDWVLFSKGFAINTFNPFTVFFWLGVITGSEMGKDHWTNAELIALVSTILVTIVAGDSLKILLAHRIGKIMKEIWRRRIEMLTGLIFAGFGAYLVYLSFRPDVVL